MKNLIIITLLATVLSLSLVLQAADFGTVRDPYVGNWTGTLTIDSKEEKVYATIIEYKQWYELTFRAQLDTRLEPMVTCYGVELKGTLNLESVANKPILSVEESEAIEKSKEAEKAPPIKGLKWQNQPMGNELIGTFKGLKIGHYSLTKIPFPPSPTLGEKSPSGALVLFDGNDLKAWESRKTPAEPILWKLVDSEAVEVVSLRDGKKNKQDLATKELFSDYRLHLEFKLADKPDAIGQGRSNSGIIHLGLYETQILDSFGLYGRNNECGGIYKTREPDSNAVYPAGLWQTYDIEVKAPRFDAEGKKTADARLTVRLNGVLVQNEVSVPKPTGPGKEVARGPIVLQDHGNPVQFRNIWAIKSN